MKTITREIETIIKDKDGKVKRIDKETIILEEEDGSGNNQ